MKFSVWPNSNRPIDEALDLGKHLDGAGWYGFWYADHYMPNTGSSDIERGDVHEVWGVLPAVAAVTSNLRVGPLVSPTSVHHPAVLANRAVTVDHVSSGRFVLGLGAGWQINEHERYGIALEPPRQRVDRFEEAIQVIRSLLDEEVSTFDGAIYQIDGAPSDPAPVQERLPILVGTSGKRMCRITAAHADEWNAWGGPDMAARSLATFRASCESVGVDPASKQLSVQALFTLSDDQATIDKAQEAGGERAVAGSVNHWLDEIGRYQELGFEEIIVPDFALGESAQARREAYDRITAEIMPQFA